MTNRPCPLSRPRRCAVAANGGAADANDAFYPAVSLEHARDTMRLDGSVTDARLRHELLAAIASVNDEAARRRRRGAMPASCGSPTYRPTSSTAKACCCSTTGAPCTAWRRRP
ncbi:head completion/stabilization protein [Pseudomonas citronellolis]|uniref:head completion/stabilization protein n=1 Tax=Pseudomonas citronellolis TaxID=53408 RepID=UPI0022A967A9|nr:head completion/stabilization protein [Pseudomonas humi]